jgi:hypothetical protein
MLPSGTLAGGSVGASVLDDAKSVLERIRKGLAGLAKRGLDAYVGADQAALRKAASVIAAGAKKAAALDSAAIAAVKPALEKLASDAWGIAVGPLVILGGVFLLMQTEGGKESKSDPLTMGAMLWMAAKFLL